MGLVVKIDGKEEINLTDFTIDNYKKEIEEFLDENNYLSEHVVGIELYGKYYIYDNSKEALEVDKLSRWSKVVAHESDCYRSIDGKFYDVNNILYDEFIFVKNFIVNYKESYDKEQGICEFYVFIRTFDNLEKSVSI